MKDHARLPTNIEIAEINARHLISTPVRPADLLFLFGTREDISRRVDEAFRLWREGCFRWSIVSGGVTPGSDRSECEVIKAAMVERGMPPEHILEEHRATNTGENVVFSLPILDAALGLENIRSVICLGNTWTARRYPMTLHRHWPAVEKMLVTVDGFETPRALWHTDPDFCRRVLSEWDKIEPYKAKGFIAEWPDGYGFILRDALLRNAPQDEDSDPHGEEPRLARRLEPRGLGRSDIDSSEP